MSNPYYVYSGAFLPGILARAEAETAEFQAVQAGFALLAIQGTDSGAANAYVVATKGGQNGIYSDGMLIEFKAANANTGASTIAVDSGSTVGLTNSNGQSLTAGAIAKNTWYRAVYNSTYSAWTIVAPTSLVTTSNTISSAAPTNKVGLVAAGGVSTACVPIDATYAIDQSIAPTWTGAHTFSSTVTFNSTVSFATALTLNGPTGNWALQVDGSSTTGQSLGLLVQAGTNASDFCFRCINQANNTNFFRVLGEGSVLVGAPTGGGQGVGTINATGLYVNGVAVSNATGANPGASVGLSTVNGSATTFLRSDGAPALSQAIAPTWTALHTFNAPTGNFAQIINAAVNEPGVQINGGINTSNQYLLEVLSQAAAGFSSGILIEAGTNSSDSAFVIKNAIASAVFMNIIGDGSGYLGPSATVNLAWTNAGAFTIAAPSSAAAAFTMNANGGQLAQFNTNTSTGGYITLGDNHAAATVGYWGHGAQLLSGAAATDMILRSEHVLKLNATGNALVMQLNGQTAPTIQGWGPTAAGVVDMTPDTGTFTITYTGMTTSITGTAVWARIGNLVTLFFPAATGTSNAATFTATGLPSAIQPARTQSLSSPDGVFESNSGLVLISSGSGGNVRVNASSGTITFLFNGNSGGWGATNTKGVAAAFSVSYLLN